MNFKYKLDSFILIKFFEFCKYYFFKNIYIFFCFVLTTVLIQYEVANNSHQDFSFFKYTTNAVKFMLSVLDVAES